VSGSATWGALDPGRASRGAINSGEIDAVGIPVGNLIAIGPDYDGKIPPEPFKGDDCRVRLRLFGPYLAVEDNLLCGGLNVTFTGVYAPAHRLSRE
jgi:hypothetical protein